MAGCESTTLRFRPLDNHFLLQLSEKSPADLRKRGRGGGHLHSPPPRSLCSGGGIRPASSAKMWIKGGKADSWLLKEAPPTAGTSNSLQPCLTLQLARAPLSIALCWPAAVRALAQPPLFFCETSRSSERFLCPELPFPVSAILRSRFS